MRLTSNTDPVVVDLQSTTVEASHDSETGASKEQQENSREVSDDERNDGFETILSKQSAVNRLSLLLKSILKEHCSRY